LTEHVGWNLASALGLRARSRPPSLRGLGVAVYQIGTVERTPRPRGALYSRFGAAGTVQDAIQYPLGV
jgi:hypothetical protein